MFILPTARGDYMDLQQSLTFEAEEDKACFEVTILDDTLREGIENFHTTVTSLPTGSSIGSPDTAIISILDDESEL